MKKKTFQKYLRKRYFKIAAIVAMLCFMVTCINIARMHVDAGDIASEEVVTEEVLEVNGGIETGNEEDTSGTTGNDNVASNIVTGVDEVDREMVEDTVEGFVSQENGIMLMSSDVADAVTDFSIVLPKEEASEYSLRLYVVRYKESGDNLSSNSTEFEIEMESADGVVTSAVYKFTAAWSESHSRSELYYDFYNLAPGTTVTIKNIQISKSEGIWDDYATTWCGTSVVSSNYTETVGFGEQDNPMQLVAEQDNVLIASSTLGATPQIKTEDTFLSLAGSYDLEYLLSSYNVVSFNNIESTHIVGSIIAQNSANRTTVSPTSDVMQSGFLAASDYSKGFSSYVGILRSRDEDSTKSAVKFNYGFDDDHDEAFESPIFYTRETDSDGNLIGLSKIEIDNGIKEYIYLNDGSYFATPNNSGSTPTLQNDEFLDFDALQKSLIAQSIQLLEDGTLEEKVEQITVESITEEDGILDVYAGTSVIIQDASDLTGVNIIFPEGFDYYTDQYSEPTTINFACSEINPIKIGNVSHSQFPVTYVNGEQVEEGRGENGEYGELGSKIIWNLPYVVTNMNTGDNRLVTYANGQNIVGHIVAPQADYWNYDDTLGWEGGNINGTIIVASFQSGNAEIHMFPYTGEAEVSTKSVSTVISAEKTFTNGNIANNTFNFILEFAGDTAIGGYDSSFVLTDESNSSGYIQFSTMKFTEAGTYVFHVYEDIPTEHALTNVEYDQSVYKVTVVVKNGSGEEDMAISTTIQKIVDEDGDSITATDATKIEFENVAKADEVIISRTFYKKDSSGTALKDANFSITQIVSFTDTSTVEGGYSASVTSKNDGAIDITNLYGDAYYKIVEVAAPGGYETPTGYWIMYVDSYGAITIKTVGDDVQEIVNNTIINERATAKTIDIPLTKADSDNHNIVLENATFTVERIVSDTDHSVVIGGYSENYKSDVDGTFTITDLQETYFYKMTETRAPDNYNLPTDYWIIEVAVGATGYTIIRVASEGVVVDEVKGDIIENTKKEPEHIDITLYKENQFGEQLTGAEFTLSIMEGADTISDATTRFPMELACDEYAHIHISDLEVGVYKLVETVAPANHYLETGYWVITVKKDDSTGELTYTIEGKDGAEVNGDIILNEKETFTLPETGGMKTTNSFYIAGGLFLLGTLLIMRRRRIV